jgi:hypothetical protein
MESAHSSERIVIARGSDPLIRADFQGFTHSTILTARASLILTSAQHRETRHLPNSLKHRVAHSRTLESVATSIDPAFSLDLEDFDQTCALQLEQFDGRRGNKVELLGARHGTASAERSENCR